MRLYYLVKTDVQSIMLTCASSQSKSWPREIFVYFLIVYLVDVFNMIEAFRENGLNTLDHNTELHETRLEAIVSSIFYALNKRLPTTHYIDVERSISLVTNWLLYAYDRWDLLNCKKSSFNLKALEITLLIIYAQKWNGRLTRILYIIKIILTWLRGFRVEIANFTWLHCLAILRRDLKTTKTKPNTVSHRKRPESLGVMLEIYISNMGYCMLYGQANLIFCSLMAFTCISYYSW